MQVDRHAATVVRDFQRAVGVQRHIEPPGVAGNGFVNAIVNDLLRQMIGPGRIGKHAGTFAHRLETA